MKPKREIARKLGYQHQFCELRNSVDENTPLTAALIRYRITPNLAKPSAEFPLDLIGPNLLAVFLSFEWVIFTDLLVAVCP